MKSQGEQPTPDGTSQGRGSAIRIEVASKLAPEEISQAAAMLAHTYEKNPLFQSASPEPERRKKVLHAIFRAVLKDGMRFGRVYIARNPSIVGVLSLYLPGGYPLSLVRKACLLPDYVWAAVADLGGFIKIARAEATVVRLHPAKLHIYVYFFGVARRDRGRGVGKALINHALSAADRSNLPVYLETHDHSNVEWYQRLGFQILRQDLDSYPGGPPTWTMWRDARPQEPSLCR